MTTGAYFCVREMFKRMYIYLNKYKIYIFSSLFQKKQIQKNILKLKI